jgi:hypothetical protein
VQAIDALTALIQDCFGEGEWPASAFTA